MIKVDWDVEELVALIDIYRKSTIFASYDVDAELRALSHRLIMRADKLGIKHDEKFRNLNGLKMMFQNITFIATDGAQGLSAASTKMKEMYSLFVTNTNVFDIILEEFNRRY